MAKVNHQKNHTKKIKYTYVLLRVKEYEERTEKPTLKSSKLFLGPLLILLAPCIPSFWLLYLCNVWASASLSRGSRSLSCCWRSGDREMDPSQNISHSQFFFRFDSLWISTNDNCVSPTLSSLVFGLKEKWKSRGFMHHKISKGCSLLLFIIPRSADWRAKMCLIFDTLN